MSRDDTSVDVPSDLSVFLFSLFLDVTLPSNLVCTCSSFEMEPARFSQGERLRSLGPVKDVHQEMVQIYEKLQVSATRIQCDTLNDLSEH